LAGRAFKKHTCLIIFTTLLMMCGCGIYTVQNSLNPPFGNQITGYSIIFSGYNTESYFEGYIIWYRAPGETKYRPCRYRGTTDIPTIPKLEDMLSDPEKGADWVKYTDYLSDTSNPRIEYEVKLEDLSPQERDDNMYKLIKIDGEDYKLGVSAYGINGEESEMIVF